MYNQWQIETIMCNQVQELVIASSGSKLFFLGGQTILAPYDLDMHLIQKGKINTTFIAELVKVIFRIKG